MANAPENWTKATMLHAAKKLATGVGWVKQFAAFFFGWNWISVQPPLQLQKEEDKVDISIDLGILFGWMEQAINDYPAPYTGPWAVTAASDTEVTIGADRAAASYLYKDFLTICEDDGTTVAVTKTTAETVTAITASCILYYQLHRASSSWTLTPLTTPLATWPPAPTTANRDDMFVPVAIILCDGGVITNIHQLLRDCPQYYPRPIGVDFQIYFHNDTAYVSAGTVQIGDTTQAVSAASYALNVDKHIWITTTYTQSTNTWAITGTLQSAASLPTLHSTTSGVTTWNIPVCQIASGEAKERHKGTINIPHVAVAPIAGDAITVSGATVSVDPSKPAAVTTLSASDVFLVKTTAGVRKITAANAAIALLKLLTGYNASNVQSIVNDTDTLAWLDMIEQQDALKEITDHGNSKTLETDAAGEALWV